ncbi:hypothetical protein FB107DRAFT_201821 [Schizophyllum commune]
MASLPVIDFARWDSGKADDRAAIARALVDACKNVGFAYITNTGIPQEEVARMFDWSAKFFALPEETKLQARHPPEGWKHRGYSRLGAEQVIQPKTYDSDPSKLAALRRAVPDLKESIEIGLEDPPRPALQNLWVPEDDIPGFRAAAVAFYDFCRDFQTNKLLPAISIGLGVDSDYLVKYHTYEDSQLRLLHYPEAPAAPFARGELGRVRAHTDYGTCTFLFQDDVGGLEVESALGEFVAATPMPGAVVFNVGDLLMRWSNDTLKSTKHRVCPPPAIESGNRHDAFIPRRYSIPYFIVPDFDKEIDCIPSCFGPDKPKKYEPVNAGDYMAMRLNGSY